MKSKTKNTVSNVFGLLAAISTALSAMGVHIGHVGAVDVNTVVAGSSIAAIGYLTGKQPK